MGRIVAFFEMFFTHFDKLSSAEFVGACLYMGSAITLVVVHIARWKGFGRGLEGDNQRWDASDFFIYLFSFVVFNILCARAFLPTIVVIDGYMYALIAGIVIFCLAGTAGLLWLRNTVLAFKNGTGSPDKNEFENPDKKEPIKIRTETQIPQQ